MDSPHRDDELRSDSELSCSNTSNPELPISSNNADKVNFILSFDYGFQLSPIQDSGNYPPSNVKELFSSEQSNDDIKESGDSFSFVLDDNDDTMGNNLMTSSHNNDKTNNNYPPFKLQKLDNCGFNDNVNFTEEPHLSSPPSTSSPPSLSSLTSSSPSSTTASLSESLQYNDNFTGVPHFSSPPSTSSSSPSSSSSSTPLPPCLRFNDFEFLGKTKIVSDKTYQLNWKGGNHLILRNPKKQVFQWSQQQTDYYLVSCHSVTKNNDKVIIGPDLAISQDLHCDYIFSYEANYSYFLETIFKQIGDVCRSQVYEKNKNLVQNHLFCIIKHFVGKEPKHSTNRKNDGLVIRGPCRKSDNNRCLFSSSRNTTQQKIFQLRKSLNLSNDFEQQKDFLIFDYILDTLIYCFRNQLDITSLLDYCHYEDQSYKKKKNITHHVYPIITITTHKKECEQKFSIQVGDHKNKLKM